jgi:hypothetical protein
MESLIAPVLVDPVQDEVKVLLEKAITKKGACIVINLPDNGTISQASSSHSAEIAISNDKIAGEPNGINGPARTGLRSDGSQINLFSTLGSKPHRGPLYPSDPSGMYSNPV